MKPPVAIVLAVYPWFLLWAAKNHLNPQQFHVSSDPMKFLATRKDTPLLRQHDFHTYASPDSQEEQQRRKAIQLLALHFPNLHIITLDDCPKWLKEGQS